MGSIRSLKVICRGVTSPEKVGWKRDKTDDQKVCLTIFMSFLDMSNQVHHVASPLAICYSHIMTEYTQLVSIHHTLGK